MEYNSIWQKTSIENAKTKDDINNLQTDILIIGGGIAGISSAYFLAKEKKKVTIIDRSSIGNGITAKTTAKISYLQKDIYQKLESNFNDKISKMYFDSQIDAIKLIKDIIKSEKIECDLEKCDSYIFTKTKKNIKKIKKEANILTSWGVKCQNVTTLPILFPIEYGICVNDTYTFHPLKYINSLKKILDSKIDIYENVTALEVIPKDDLFLVKTTKGTIKSKYLIIACHYPFFIFPGSIFLKTYIEREYVNSAKYKLNSKNFTALSIDKKLHSIRFFDNNIIYVSNSHRLTNNIVYKNNYNQSRSDFKRLFSKEPELTWMNQDIMSNDNLPIIGRVDNKHNNLLVATAFNAWGMTNGTIAGKVLSDIILGNENKYIKLFNPRRISIIGSIKSFIGSMYYAKIYCQTTIKRNSTFNNNSVYVVRINGNYYGVYYDYYGKKHMVKNKCPHMKCNLIFNEEEKTWDCPCHGSRFDIDGNVIQGPANYSISVKIDD